MKIYFSGSIRGGRNDRELYSQIIKLLSEYGTVLTEHIGDSNLSISGEDGLDDKYIHDRDLNWLKEADVVIAEVTTPSLGVGYEIAKAEGLNKPILCLYRKNDEKKLSAMIAGSDRLICKEYENIEELKLIFKEFFI
jgi:nucleoside 2-deoxyribosyltransferase